MTNVLNEDEEDSKVYWANDGYKEQEDKYYNDFYNVKKFAEEINKDNPKKIKKIIDITDIIAKDMRNRVGTETIIAAAYYGVLDTPHFELIAEKIDKFTYDMVKIMLENKNKSIKDYLDFTNNIKFGTFISSIKIAEIIYNLRNIESMPNNVEYVKEIDNYLLDNEIREQKFVENIFLSELEKAKKMVTK